VSRAALLLLSLPLLAVSSPLAADVARVPPPEVLEAIVDREGPPTPRGLAPGERVPAPPSVLILAPPSGEVRTQPEYARNRGLLITWRSFTSVLTAMTVAVTTGDPDAIVWVVVENAATQSSATTTLTSAGADMSQVQFIVAPTNSVWIRDYGPRFVDVDKQAASVDHIYNRPRPLDDVIPNAVASAWGHSDYDLPLVHGGGNFHLFGDGRAFMTELVLTENPGLTAPQIEQLFADYENLDVTIWPGFPTSYDSTRHLDMWMLPVRDRVAIVGEYAVGQGGGVPRQITEDAVDDLEALGYTVFRTPGWRSGATHYTYTNAVVLNRLVLVPTYTSYPTENAQALATFAAAFPGHQIVPIDADQVVPSAGVLHCIVMHVPDPAFLSWQDFETGDTSTWSGVSP
jgi:agmatine/peptidylarginine deiminase